MYPDALKVKRIYPWELRMMNGKDERNGWMDGWMDGAARISNLFITILHTWSFLGLS